MTNDISPIKDWTLTLVEPTRSIREMLVVMGGARQQIVLVVDGDRRLIGTITDGDVRRSILAGIPPDDPVTSIMNPNPIATTPRSDAKTRLSIMRENSILHLPVVNETGRVIGMARLDSLSTPDEAIRKNRVLLMAGGLGSRLSPLTDEVPKPLLSVGSRPILETIVAQLVEQHFRKFYFSVNHKAQAIKDHFGDGSKFGVEIDYLEETARLGTAGALGLISDPIEAPLILMNGDLLTKVDFEGMLIYHAEHDAQITVGMRDLDMQVPFGVLEMEDAEIRAVIEKPIQRFRINAGIYVLEPDILKWIPDNSYRDMPDLLRELISDGARVTGFPIHEYWLDIGRHEDFSRAKIDYNAWFS